MKRLLLAALAVAAVAPVASAKRAAPPNPVQRALAADVVVVGKVTAVEKEAVELPPFPGSPDNVAHRVAVVKVETGLAGADNLTHVKVAFLPPPAGADGALGRRRPFGPVSLAVGQEGLFFLTKHPTGGFYTVAPMAPPVDAAADDFKAQTAVVVKALAAVADPAKALKADKADDRAFAAAVIVMKYRTAPADGGEAAVEPLPADESNRLLRALAEGEWTNYAAGAPAAVNAFYLLGLTPENGWAPPKPVAPQPGRPAANYNAALQTAFVAWLDGPGKDYRVGKFVAKKK